MLTEVVGQLLDEDLLRWRRVITRWRAVELNPTAFSQNETEQIVGERASLTGELLKRYEVDDSKNWALSESTGLIYYSEQP